MMKYILLFCLFLVACQPSLPDKQPNMMQGAITVPMMEELRLCGTTSDRATLDALCRVVAPNPQTLIFTQDLWNKVVQVNTLVNANIKYIPDIKQYKELDHWAFGEDTDEGDCEDYALAKFKRLLAAGVPASSMRIAAVYVTSIPEALSTRENVILHGLVNHAVLLIFSDRGTIVLDNRFNVPYEWSVHTDYIWIKCMSSDTIYWVDLRGNNGT